MHQCADCIGEQALKLAAMIGETQGSEAEMLAKQVRELIKKRQHVMAATDNRIPD
jgi:hypothetical protein